MAEKRGQEQRRFQKDLKKHAQHIVKQCDKLTNKPFKNLDCIQNTFYFTFQEGLVKKQFCYYYDDHYPDDTTLSVTDLSVGVPCTNSDTCVNKNIIDVFQDVATDLKITLPSGFDVLSSDEDDDDDDVSAGEDDEDDDDLIDSDFEDLWRRQDEESIPSDVSSTLAEVEHDLADVNRVFEAYSAEPIATYIFERGLLEIIVFLNLDISFIPRDILSIWKLHFDQPLVLQINIPELQYRSGERPPPVRVYQSSCDDQVPNTVLLQLKSILENFLREVWFDGNKSASPQCPSPQSPSPQCPSPSHEEKKENPNKVFKTISKICQKLKPKDGEQQDGVQQATIHEQNASFLTRTMMYMKRRLSTINAHCVICDEQHIYSSATMVKPTVCERELCVFAYQTLGVMRGALSDLSSSPDVINLLVELAKDACRCKRRQSCLQPYPLVVNPSKPTELAFNPKEVDHDKVEACLQTIPAFPELVNIKTLRKRMNEKDQLAYPLLEWIISSNRSHIVSLPTLMKMQSMRTEYQFLLRSAPPKQEEAFLKAKKKHGSLFAFHGSPFCNWHSIIRQGLVVASGTNLQLHGTAFGSGIYLSPSWGMSCRYSRDTQYNSAADYPTGMFQFCLALCEVIDSPELKKHKTKDREHIWVMSKPEYVCTRFFLIYKQATVNCHVNSTDPRICQEISHAMNFISEPSADKVQSFD